MCQHLQVSTSGYYDWLGRAPSARAQANTALTAQIQDIHSMSDATYGMPRIRAELADAGVLASRKRIARLMREAHIQGVSRRRGYVVTTTRDKRQRSAPDLVKRQFVATDINQLWVADMTYVPTWAGFAVSGGGHRRVQPQGGGLVVWCAHDGRSGACGAEHGAAYTQT
jgi:putative transposase